MGCNVFANGRAVCGQADSHEVPVAFPDPCFSPPAPPAGPLPLPYPITASSSNLKGGTKKVFVAGKPLAMRDISYYEKCDGDTAATKSFGMGVVSHQLEGKFYFKSWSLDVTVDGEAAARHLDMMTGNHMGKEPGNESVPAINIKDGGLGDGGFDCSETLANFPVMSHKDQKARLKEANEGVTEAKQKQQSHHVLQNALFQTDRSKNINAPGVCPGYDTEQAPCIGLAGSMTDLDTPHGVVTAMQNADTVTYQQQGSVTFAEARSGAKKQLMEPEPGPGLSEQEAECILLKVEEYFDEACKGGNGRNGKLRVPQNKVSAKPKLKAGPRKVYP